MFQGTNNGYVQDREGPTAAYVSTRRATECQRYAALDQLLKENNMSLFQA